METETETQAETTAAPHFYGAYVLTYGDALPQVSVWLDADGVLNHWLLATNDPDTALLPEDDPRDGFSYVRPWGCILDVAMTLTRVRSLQS